MAGYIKTDVVILYKNSKRSNSKLRMKVLKECTADYVISKLSGRGLPGISANAEIINIGVGTIFKEKWRKKYNL